MPTIRVSAVIDLGLEEVAFITELCRGVVRRAQQFLD